MKRRRGQPRIRKNAANHNSIPQPPKTENEKQRVIPKDTSVSEIASEVKAAKPLLYSSQSNTINWGKLGTLLKFIMDVILFLAAIFGAYLAYRGVIIYNGQWSVAQAQLKEMKRTRILDERAWVYSFGVTNNQSFESPNFVVFHKNNGRTPALHVHACIAVTNNKDVIPTSDYYNAEGHTKGVLVTGEADHSTLPNPPEITIVVSQAKAGLPVYIFGTVWYDDVFGGHHWSQYCWQILPSLTEFRPSPFHNESDTEVD